MQVQLKAARDDFEDYKKRLTQETQRGDELAQQLEEHKGVLQRLANELAVSQQKMQDQRTGYETQLKQKESDLSRQRLDLGDKLKQTTDTLGALKLKHQRMQDKHEEEIVRISEQSLDAQRKWPE